MAGNPKENDKIMEEHLENMQKVHERQYPFIHVQCYYSFMFDI